MNWYAITGIASIIALFFPALLILAFKLYKNVSLLILFLYYAITAAYNLMAQGVINIPSLDKNNFGIIANYLDAPMMLAVLLYFCVLPWKRKIIYYSLALFGVFELIILFYYQLAPVSSVYILGPGILLILIYSIYLFFEQGKATVVHGKGLGLTLMLVSILFSYGCFTLIYFLHYIKKTPATADVFLIYYIVLFISSVLMSLGIIWLRKRIQHINEVQVTRKELAHFFQV
ncbi:MAG: hypothetical protein ABIN57_02585 [Chitinophagaceae bacterium]